MELGWKGRFRHAVLLKWTVIALCVMVLLQGAYFLRWYVSTERYVPVVPPERRRIGRFPGFDTSALSTETAPNNYFVSITLHSTHQERTTTITFPESTVATATTALETAIETRERTSLLPTEYFNPAGHTWRKGSFCNAYVENTFQVPIGVCGPQAEPEHNIKCHRSAHSKVMLYCVLESVFIPGPRMIGSKKLDVGLLTGAGRSCSSISLSEVHKNSERNSRCHTLLDRVAEIEKKPLSFCENWINKTAFLYTADQNVHIYFRMNAYHNLHKAIAREGVAPGDFVIIKHPFSSSYLFSEWEKYKLFPEMVDLDELPNKTLCFRKLVIVPFSFSGIPFRCKMESNVRGPCFNCKGRGLYGSSFYSFRHRVISSCGLVDEKKHVGNRITIISRTPYKRWSKDDFKKFQRILENEDDLVNALRKGFPNTNVTVAHMEKLGICEQISLAHDADVLMGVHGAGLVHLWWLQEDALILELNPTFQKSNPSFKMLSTLAGRNYDSITVSGSPHLVRVKVDSVLDFLKSKTHLS